MQNLKISLIQTHQEWEDIEQNLLHFAQKIDALETADLIVLPEMFQTSFSMNTALAEDWNSSKTLSFLKEKAKQKSAAIYTSILISDSGSIRNRGVFVYPDGRVDFYDKRKGFGLAKETEFIQSGDKQVVVEYLGWKIQLQICYDLRFPEILRNQMEDSNQIPAYDVLLFVANWPEKRVEHWSTLLRARAIENQCFCIGLNRVGLDGKGLSYNGQSAAFDALGKALFEPQENDTSITFELKSAELQSTRDTLPFLKDQSIIKLIK